MSNTKQNLRCFIILLVSGLMFSCVSSKKINYFEGTDENQFVNERILNYEPPLQIGDMLTINVSAIDQEAAIPFNLFEVQTVAAQIPLSYIIDIEGFINFPVLGRLKAAGFTTKQLTGRLVNKLNPYLKQPIVNIRIVNFRVTVLGEVKIPGSYPVLNERLSIIDAIGLAGDLTIYGDRRNITLVREQGGKRTFETIDLTNKALFDSPYFYLSQNDALYVPANNTRVNSSGVGPNTSVIISALSILLTLVAILVR